MWHLERNPPTVKGIFSERKPPPRDHKWEKDEVRNMGRYGDTIPKQGRGIAWKSKASRGW